VEARGGQGGVGVPEKLRVAGEIVERRAGAGEPAGYSHGEDDVAPVADAGVARRVAVAAAGLELIAQGRLVHQDVHEHGDEGGDEDAAVDLGVGEEDVEPHLGRLHAVEGGLVYVAG